MATGAPSYRGFGYPVEIISLGVWLYYRFPLSLREVQEVMLVRGVTVSHENHPAMVRQVRGNLRQGAASPSAKLG